MGETDIQASISTLSQVYSKPAHSETHLGLALQLMMISILFAFSRFDRGL